MSCACGGPVLAAGKCRACFWRPSTFLPPEDEHVPLSDAERRERKNAASLSYAKRRRLADKNKNQAV